MKILMDANVPLNVWLTGEKRVMVEESRTIIKAVAEGRVRAYMTMSLVLYTLSNLGRKLDQDQYKRIGSDLLDIVSIIDQPKEMFRSALRERPWKDMEDFFQYHTAKRYSGQLNAIAISPLSSHYRQSPATAGLCHFMHRLHATPCLGIRYRVQWKPEPCKSGLGA